MTIYDSLRIVAATGCGIQIGGFLLLSLFHRPLLAQWPADTSYLWLFKRFYRFNILLSIISGIIAIFAEARTSGFLLAILGMTYVLLLTHLLPAITHNSQYISRASRRKLRRSPDETLQLFSYLQKAAHFSQLLALFYIAFSLTQ